MVHIYLPAFFNCFCIWAILVLFTSSRHPLPLVVLTGRRNTALYHFVQIFITGLTIDYLLTKGTDPWVDSNVGRQNSGPQIPGKWDS